MFVVTDQPGPKGWISKWRLRDKGIRERERERGREREREEVKMTVVSDIGSWKMEL